MLVIGDMNKEYADILTPDAHKFLYELHCAFQKRIRSQLSARKAQKVEFQAGELPDFIKATEEIRDTEWKVAPIPADMQRRVVEITGPVDRKMVINALNSGADCFMADFEDSNSPTWHNCMQGQINLRDAVNRTISLETPKKTYKLNNKIAKLMVRPRGWHLREKHCICDGEVMSASLFDFGLFFYHNAETMIERGETPAFYLPKIEHYMEARLWADVFKFAEEWFDLPYGSIRATVLIETLPVAFQMNEILWELKDYSAGLNAGRWDYIFSAIKTLGNDSRYIFPNRSEVTMDKHMMMSYAKLLVETCHKRGVHGMGGMSAYIPRKDDAEKNNQALNKVKQDKLAEASLGHDGTWVAHPGLLDIARNAFEVVLNGRDNQIDRQLNHEIKQTNLLRVPQGNITYEELCNNVRVSIQYIASWLEGNGCVPLNYLMEDAATAEISRTQVWQWLHHEVNFSDGDGKVDKETVTIVIDQELRKLEEEQYSSAEKLNQATELFSDLVFAETCEDFLTLPAYELLA